MVFDFSAPSATLRAHSHSSFSIFFSRRVAERAEKGKRESERWLQMVAICVFLRKRRRIGRSRRKLGETGGQKWPQATAEMRRQKQAEASRSRQNQLAFFYGKGRPGGPSEAVYQGP